jgi:MarR family transcriptional regulator, lower aerobic nicotinate degradation pathway regulator
MAPESDSVTTSTTVDALVQLSFAVQLLLTRVAAEHDLSVTQLRLLGILRDRTPTMAAIADFLELDRSSVSGLIDRAERRGLVARRTSGQDARVTLVEATADGFAVGRLISASVNASLESLLASASASERASFTTLATRIVGS